MAVMKSGQIGSSAQQVQELVRNASVVIAHYWPMTSFVHHNPIRSLETLQFEEAVKVGERFIGGRGYLPNESYRELVQAGRIKYEQLDAAIRSVARDESLEVAGRTVSHFDVLRAHMLIGITAPSTETISALVDRSSISAKLPAPRQSSEGNATAPPNVRISAADIRELAIRLGTGSECVDESGKIGTSMTLLSWCGKAVSTQVEWQANKQLIKWCAAFLDEGHAAWPMPYREKGFYEAWKTLAALEWSPCGIKGSAKKIRALPASPEQAILEHLDAMGIPDELRQEYLSLELAALHGWASFIHWRSEQTSHPWQTAYPIDLVQYLAVRLFYERELVDQACRSEFGIEGKFHAIVSHVRAQEARTPASVETARLAAAWRLAMLGSALQIPLQQILPAADRLLTWLDNFPESTHGPVWLKAYEAGYQEDLMQKLRAAVSEVKNQTVSPRPLAQLTFCIDVRSEPFRRNLESVGNYQTIGFAGFYGIPVRCRALDQYHETDQAPAIVPTKYTAHEVPRANQKDRLGRHNAGAAFIFTIQEMLHDTKHHVLTPYIMVESLGWLFGVQLFGRTLFPLAYRKWLTRMQRRMVPPVRTQMTVDKTAEDLGLTQQEQCATVETVLRLMGLTENFARLVVVCGHCSTSDNNPYEAALNCGACGGNSGKPNARLFAAMANKPYVREHLAKNRIIVPNDTHFVGGVHNTTTDIIELFDLEDLPDSHAEDLERLKADLKQAAVLTNHERCTRLPNAGKDLSPARATKEIARRAGDWSETRPEWGLAGNASYIIGDRMLTKNIDLEGRAFLNSYDYRLDSTGSLLESVMLGPMLVGQWINAEHYFSATDTDVYGSGSKIYHNVVGRVGIMSGPQSDLRTGLAWQSTMNGELPYHEPVRLVCVIEAPRERILEIVERHPVLKQLCDNEWIHLVAVDHESADVLYRYKAKEGWTTEASERVHGPLAAVVVD